MLPDQTTLCVFTVLMLVAGLAAMAWGTRGRSDTYLSVSFVIAVFVIARALAPFFGG